MIGRTTRRVGIIGMPGCGKSAVLADLARRGHPTWSADACVAELYQPGHDGWELLRRRFGTRFVPSDSAPVDKAALLEAMRASDNFRREVMELVYPPALDRLRSFWREHQRSRAAFAEVPMLLEAGWLAGGEVDFAVGGGLPARRAPRPPAGQRLGPGYHRSRGQLAVELGEKTGPVRLRGGTTPALWTTCTPPWAFLNRDLRRERTAWATSLLERMRAAEKAGPGGLEGKARIETRVEESRPAAACGLSRPADSGDASRAVNSGDTSGAAGKGYQCRACGLRGQIRVCGRWRQVRAWGRWRQVPGRDSSQRQYSAHSPPRDGVGALRPESGGVPV